MALEFWGAFFMRPHGVPGSALSWTVGKVRGERAGDHAF